MAEPVAYQSTTEPIMKTQPDRDPIQIAFKVAQLLFSLVAFVCEEIISQCESCFGLYFFEFVSCSAFLISILMCVVYFSPLKGRINIPSFKKVDFWITLATGVFLFIASIVFISTIEKTTLAETSVAFGFLACFAFLGELFYMWKKNYLQSQEKPKTQPSTNGGTEGEPLNYPVPENHNA